MKKKLKISLIVIATLVLLYYLSPVYILPESNWWASEFCKEKSWSDWYAVYSKWGVDFVICDIR